MMYNEKVMEIFKNPKNVGKLKGANAIGQVGNVACGDIMKIYLKINENDVIQDASFETFGCAAAIVSSSIATELIKGWTVDQALNFDNDLIIKEVGELPVHKIHCSVLAKEAIEDAITKYRKKQAKQAKTEQTGKKNPAKAPKTKASATSTTEIKTKTELKSKQEVEDKNVVVENKSKNDEKKANLSKLNSTMDLLKNAKKENEKAVVKEEKKEVKTDDLIKGEVFEFDNKSLKRIDKELKAEKKAKKDNAKKLDKNFLSLTKKIKKL